MPEHESLSCPHLLAAVDGQTVRCRLAEFSLYALLEENARLKRGLRELQKVLGPPCPRRKGEIPSLEEVRLTESAAFLDALLGHEVGPVQ
jgi:hypothetical protein